MYTGINTRTPFCGASSRTRVIGSLAVISPVSAAFLIAASLDAFEPRSKPNAFSFPDNGSR